MKMKINESSFKLICQKSVERGFGKSINLEKCKKRGRYGAELVSWNRIFTNRGEVNRCLVSYQTADGDFSELIDIEDQDLKVIQNGRDSLR